MLSIGRLRRAAKTLSKDHAAGDPAALQRIRMHPPRAEGVALKHADFLQVVAQEQGFASWPALKLAAETQGLDLAAKQQRLKIAIYHGQGWIVEQLLTQTPDLAKGMFGLQCALYDAEGVREALWNDPSLATQEFGPRRPILHLAFSRWIKQRPDLEPQMMQVAQLLLDHGADVNDGFPMHPGSDHLLSALYGAIGHADNMVLGEWLLDNGADPNDNESLYHATELGHHDGLRLLLRHGADPRGTNALFRAMDFDDVAAVRMLIDAGADVGDFNEAEVGGEKPWVTRALFQAARRGSSPEMIDLILDQGVDVTEMQNGATPYAFARVQGHAYLAEALAALGADTTLSAEERALALVAEGSVPDGVTLTDAQLPKAYQDMIRTILHLPGRLDHVRRLVSLGLDPDRADGEGLTPVQVAGWEGLPDVMAFLLTQNLDLFHVNGYGGSLISTIIHGSENAPDRDTRDHVGCLRLALEAGAILQEAEVRFAGREDVSEFLQAWAEDHPTQVGRN